MRPEDTHHSGDAAANRELDVESGEEPGDAGRNRGYPGEHRQGHLDAGPTQCKPAGHGKDERQPGGLHASVSRESSA